MLQQSLDFRCECKNGVACVVIERLDSQPVTGAEQPAAALVPQCKGEHAAKARHTIPAVLLEGMNDGLCIATAKIAMPGPFERGPQIGVIEDLAVVDDSERTILIAHRLMPA